MNDVETILKASDLRAALLKFWDDALAIEKCKGGFAIAMPQTGLDGWQLVIEVEAGPPGKLRLSDAGRTLGALEALGQNIEATAVNEKIHSILRVHEIDREGFELYRWLGLPLNAVDVHVFVEGLAAVSHLANLHEPVVRALDIANKTLERVFADRKIIAKRGAVLTGKAEKSIRVDYLADTKRPVAVEILRRKSNLLPVMEQWGFRWQDIQKVNPNVIPVMLYDRAVQEIDEASRAIGEEVCKLFCAYDETDRIHSVLDESMRDAA